MNVCRRGLLLRAHLRSYVHRYNQNVINSVAIGQRSIHNLKTKPAPPIGDYDFGATESNAAKVSTFYFKKMTTLIK